MGLKDATYIPFTLDKKPLQSHLQWQISIYSDVNLLGISLSYLLALALISCDEDTTSDDMTCVEVQAAGLLMLITQDFFMSFG